MADNRRAYPITDVRTVTEAQKAIFADAVERARLLMLDSTAGYRRACIERVALALLAFTALCKPTQYVTLQAGKFSARVGDDPNEWARWGNVREANEPVEPHLWIAACPKALLPTPRVSEVTIVDLSTFMLPDILQGAQVAWKRTPRDYVWLPYRDAWNDGYIYSAEDDANPLIHNEIVETFTPDMKRAVQFVVAAFKAGDPIGRPDPFVADST